MNSATNPDSEFLPLKRAYRFLEKKELHKEAEDIKRTQGKVKGFNTTTIRKSRILHLLEDKKLLDEFIGECWPHALTEDGQKRVKRYKRCYELWNGGGPEDGEDEADDSALFAFEDHLRDYLGKNPDALEPGLTLWPVEANKTAAEYNLEGSLRRIDLLAKDKNGVPVVVELKVSRGHERVIGQVLYYRAKIKEILKSPKVRIMIVAGEISPELRSAASEIPDVTLLKYQISMKVAPA